MLDYNITYRQKDKGWQYIISYKVNGEWKQKSKQGFKTKKDAKPVAEKQLEHLKGLFENQSYADSFNITFGQFKKLYFENLSLSREKNTLDCYDSAMKNFEELDDIEMLDLSSIDIQKCVNSMIKRKLSASTISFYFGRLKTLLKAAKEEYKLINSIPIEGIKLPKDKKEDKIKALNKKEVDALLKTFSKDKYYLILFIAAKCGLRLGEILGLTWSDIDEKNNLINVNKQWKSLKTGGFGFGSVKGKNSNRQVPISEKTKKTLLKFKTVIDISKGDDTRIFTFNNTASVDININLKLRNRGYDITIHCLRHTYATMLIGNGADFKTVAKLLGHTVEQTMKTYSHVNDDMMKRATNIIEKIF